MLPTMKLIRALLSAAAVLALVGCGATTATSGVSSPTPTPVDVAGAQRAALTLFVEADPGWWTPCLSTDNYAACPLSASVKARLTELTSANYFNTAPGGHCAGDFISNSTNGIFRAPAVLSAVAETNGNVTVVIHRETMIPTLTAVMAMENDRWLATDLASGTGPSASIFSASPNC